MPTAFYTGYLLLGAIKLAGYCTFSAAWLNRSYNKPLTNVLLVGFVRTVIGILVGTLYWYLTLDLFRPSEVGSGWVQYFGLLPIRIGEWWLLIWLFYDREFQQKRKGWINTFLGTICSFILDVPGLLGVVIIARGLFIC